MPDYITSVKDGGFYGWPFSYYGQHVDLRVKPQNPDLVAKAIAPDYARRPAHRLAGPDLRRGQQPAGAVQGGAFIGPARLVEPQAAQWLQSDFRAVYAQASRAAQPVECADRVSSTRTRTLWVGPVGVVIDQQGGLLVADDVGNKVWRVSATQ